MAEWRQAVQKAMFEATQQEALKRYGVAEPAFNYRWEHVTAVVEIALKLAGRAGADREIVEAAAWLHDIAKGEKENHPAAGAAFARQFLPQTDFPPEKIEAVAQAIGDHMGLWRDEPLTNLEAMVLWDADKLTKIGLTAAFHWLGLFLMEGETTTLQELIERGRTAQWQARTVDSMHTAPAQRAAQKRLVAYNQLWDMLEGELRGEDLE